MTPRYKTFNHADDWTNEFVRHLSEFRAIVQRDDTDDDTRWILAYIKEVQARFDDGETLLTLSLIKRLSDRVRKECKMPAAADQLDATYHLLAHLYAWEKTIEHSKACDDAFNETFYAVIAPIEAEIRADIINEAKPKEGSHHYAII